MLVPVVVVSRIPVPGDVGTVQRVKDQARARMVSRLQSVKGFACRKTSEGTAHAPVGVGLSVLKRLEAGQWMEQSAA
jgi:hypothetical protein